MVIPFLLKRIVDGLDVSVDTTISAMLLLGLVLAYGTSRFSNVLFGEIRDTVFGRVTERAMRFLGLQVFRHLHRLDLDFHLNRGTGGLARDIERGHDGYQLPDALLRVQYRTDVFSRSRWLSAFCCSTMAGSTA